MADPFDRPSPTRAWKLALFAGLIIFAGRSALVFYAGSPVPFHDQWVSEGEQILAHDARHTLTWHNFVIPNGDHLMVTTRLIAWSIFRLTGHWDVLAEMLVNNALLATAFAVLIGFFLNRRSGFLIASIFFVAAAWLASPLFYGNALWGFQSGIALLVLAAVVQIVATSTMEMIGPRWWLALLAALLGSISFGGAFFAPGVCLLVCGLRSRDPLFTRRARVSSILVNLGIVLLGIFLTLRIPSLAGGAPRAGDVLHTLLHALSWPAMHPSWLALVLWLPASIATAGILKIRRAATLVAYACAIWTLLQIVAIALARSAPVPALAPRYYDIFAVGVIANGMLCASFIDAAKGLAPWRAAAVIFALAWGGWVGGAGWMFARSHIVHDVPTIRGFSRGQIELLNRYYAGEGSAALTTAGFPVRPHPDAAQLEKILVDPAIVRALPKILTQAAASSKDRELTAYSWPDGSGPTRRTWLWLCAGLGVVAALGYIFFAAKLRLSRRCS